MKALVTGGAGFIGSHLVKRLVKDGVETTVIDDLSGGKWENLEGIDCHKQELSILDDLDEVMAGKDVVFHLAALPRVQRSIKEPYQTHLVNVDGTLRLLLSAKKHGVKRFVFSSSSSVYGEQFSLPFLEGMTLNPVSPYALQKRIGEEYCELFSKIYGLSTISLRYFNVYGTNMDPSGDYATLIPKFIKKFQEGEVPVINGDGEQRRDFTFVEDVVEANILAAKSVYTGVLNIGSGKNLSVNEVSRILKEELKSDIEPIHGPAILEPRVSLADKTNAANILGWKPNFSFKEGVHEIIRCSA